MLELILWILVFIVSCAFLFRASDYFTDSAESIGIFFRLPAFIIGVTIVAVGTSLPELVSSVFAVLDGHSEIVSGNVVGSNITNIFFVLGVAAIVGKRMKFDHNIISVDLPILIASAFLLLLMAGDGQFTLVEAILSLIGALVYLGHTVLVEKKIGKEETKELKELISDQIKSLGKIKIEEFPVKSLIILIVSSLIIFVSAKFTVESVLVVSGILGIATEIIAASAVALGTSLPELMVSLSAVRKGNAEVAVGNVLGSNVFNTLSVMGVAGLFGTLLVPTTIVTFGLPIMVVATLLYLFITQDKEVTRWEGGFLLIFYAFYLWELFNWLG